MLGPGNLFMRKDDRDLLEVLKFELLFLQKGGYGRLRSQGGFSASAAYFRRLTHLHELWRP
jgi:hypothetical protein